MEKIEISVIEDKPSEIRVENTTYHHNLKDPILGGERMHLYIDSLKGKRVAIVGNQTSLIGKNHLVDTLLSLGVKIQKVFSRHWL